MDLAQRLLKVEVVILSNLADTGSTNQPKDQSDAATVVWNGSRYTILGGSCVLLRGGKVIFNSSIDSDGPTTGASQSQATTTMVASHPVSGSRHLSSMKKDGLVATQRGQIEILQPLALARLE